MLRPGQSRQVVMVVRAPAAEGASRRLVRQQLERTAEGDVDVTTPEGHESHEVQVHGRPTGFAGGEHERRWKQAVGDAFGDSALPAEARVEVLVDFVLGPSQGGSNEPDLDNLIKSTVDALVDVIGVRPQSGSRQADDVRIDRITASKRFAVGEEESGASITVRRIG